MINSIISALYPVVEYIEKYNIIIIIIQILFHVWILYLLRMDIKPFTGDLSLCIAIVTSVAIVRNIPLDRE